MSARPTPGQTVGPFFALRAAVRRRTPSWSRPRAPDAIRLHGRVLDGAGDPVPDALLELWQADADGVSRSSRARCARRLHLHRLGPRRDRRRRAATRSRRYAGAAEPGGGVLRDDRLRPRPAGPAVHPRLPARQRRATAPTRCSASPRTAGRPWSRPRDERGYVFDIRLQGDGETVFLSFPRALTHERPASGPATNGRGDHLTARAFLRAMVDGRGGLAGRARRGAHGPLTSMLDSTADWSRGTERRQPGDRRWWRSCANGSTPDAARWLHRGLTSQDVVDSALMVLLRDAVAEVRRRAARADRHRWPTSPRRTGPRRWSARTLTQHAVPTTFGLKVAGWLTGVLDAERRPGRARLPRAARWRRRHPGRGRRARPRRRPQRGTELADALGLAAVAAVAHRPGARSPGSATPRSRCTDAWGRIANDVLDAVPSRDRRAGGGRGRRVVDDAAQGQPGALRRWSAAPRLTAPQLAATLHLAAADAVDERAAGAWHAEWATLATLVRRTVVAGAQTDRPAWRAAGARRPDGRHPGRGRDDVWPSSARWPSWPGTSPPTDYLGAHRRARRRRARPRPPPPGARRPRDPRASPPSG